MAFIQTHQSLRDHRKILELAARLDMSEAHVSGHCIFLWLWAIDNAPDGILPASNRIIERAAGWEGESGVLVDALVSVGLLEVGDDQQLHIHDWDDYTGRLIEQRNKNAERMREARARKRNNTQTNNVQQTFDARAGAIVEKSIQEKSSSGDQDTLGDLSASGSINAPSEDKHMLPPQQLEQLSLPDYCQEIEFAMVACGANPNYVVKKEALDWVKKFHASKVPIDFVKTGIQKCYDDNPEIHTFTYCAMRIEEWWAKELAFQTSAEPIDFQMRLAASRASPGESRYVPQGLPPEAQEWDKFAKRGTS
ncbi:hypothetical protein [Alicyclobacillus dauci]|uniref:Uncharacterized protein n=1 Tax=Alicyclobacillus dauci TaxID=1475485 RepID=A0ABY6Z8K5_9BACL|nr:hypothetical protein [Alicyclobacillus dauci]WAH38586.1 hypothetical protein NZD86_08940 [Alicyclobacillus dauci]